MGVDEDLDDADEAVLVKDIDLVSVIAAMDVMLFWGEVVDEVAVSARAVLLAEGVEATVCIAPPLQSSSGPWLMLKCDDAADNPCASTTLTCAANPAVKANTQSTDVSLTTATSAPVSALATTLYGGLPPDQDSVVAWHWTTFRGVLTRSGSVLRK